MEKKYTLIFYFSSCSAKISGILCSEVYQRNTGYSEISFNILTVSLKAPTAVIEGIFVREEVKDSILGWK